MAEAKSPGQIPVGSNLFELIEFTLTNGRFNNPLLDQDSGRGSEPLIEEPTLFGVNVAKVREVIRLPRLEPSLGKRPEVLGIFELRGQPIPAIHLSYALGFSQEPVLPSAQVLVTEFSGRLTGFVVASARRIRRVSWDQVLPPQRDLFGGITGMMLDEKKRFIFILDFEKVLSEVQADEMAETYAPPAFAPQVFPAAMHAQAVTGMRLVSDELPAVLIVDDSSTARKALLDIVKNFRCNIVECIDGEQAWSECVNLSNRGVPFVVISDVEMPRLDGYSFARRLKTDPRFAGTPFLLHSSLTGAANRERALASGADAFIGKFNKRDIIAALETCLAALPARERAVS